MIHHERLLELDAGPEDIWAVLDRFMHIDEFAPLVVSVEALTETPVGIGSKRRCHFADGNSVVEEVTAWEANRRCRVRLSDTDPMPLMEAHAEISITPQGSGRSTVRWSMDYRLKYGPFGWLLGQTVMKRMMSKVLDGNLHGLADKVRSDRVRRARSA